MSIKFLPAAVLAIASAASVSVSKAQSPSTAAEPPVTPLKAASVEQTIKSFQLADGYRIEKVVAEPEVKEPVSIAFDGDGRMFVAEMRTYMQDADGTDEHAHTSRISLHWSSKKDGNFDKHSVFLDGLLLPRMILPLGKGELLVNETDTLDIFLYKDTDGDGVSDQKTLWFEGGPRGGNMEHQQSGLIWASDNWMYATYSAFRLKWQPNGQPPLKEPTPGNGGQWGLTQDDYGKPWFVNAGGERGPLNFQTHIVYGSFNLKNQFSSDFAEVYPVVGIADVQGGDKRYRAEDGTLNHFTATCGAEVFRGDRLPKDLRGDLLFSEPVGRLIRRTKIDVRDGLTYLSNACEKSEFIRSSDPFFRAVNMNTAPDGTLFITDMYRGVIQEGNWVKEGSYLRRVVKQYALDKVTSNGRIWRLAHRDFAPGPQPSMYSDSPAKLVEHLSHPNGWWRDMAQRQLVLRQDKSVVPALVRLATGSADNTLARIHAIWTLEGLGALDAQTVRAGLSAKQPEVRNTAIRASETLFKNGDASFGEDYARLAADSDPTVAIQAMCTMRLLAVPAAKSVVQNCALGKMGGAGMKEIAKMMMAPPRTWGKEFSGAQVSLLQKGDAIFGELCFACHNLDGRGTPLDGKDGFTLAPPLAGSQTVNGPKDAFIAVLLKGIGGPINGKTYESQMVPMESNNDEWIAAVGSYVRNSFGNKSSTIAAADVAKVRKEIAERSTPWTAEELRAFGPPTVGNRGQWKLNASHNAASVAKAVDGLIETRYDTRTPQVPGMWVEVVLPQATEVTGLRLEHGSSGGDYPRGYLVQTSSDGVNWIDVKTGEGKAGVMEIRFDTVKAKAVRITQTSSVKGSYWSIHELELLSPESKTVASK